MSKKSPFIITEIDVKGDMVLGNDLRTFFPDDVVFLDGWYSINSDAGLIRRSHDYAKSGMLTGFLGNIGGSIFHTPTSIVLAAEDADTIVIDDIEHRRAGCIITDLWWYGAADLELLKQINAEEAKKIEPVIPDKCYGGTNLFHIPVQPGRWRMTHYGQDYGDQPHRPYGKYVYSRIQLVDQ